VDSVRLDVVVPVVVLDYSRMFPGRRIDGATGCRSSVLVWAARDGARLGAGRGKQ
jgi:hypothetical protein